MEIGIGILITLCIGLSIWAVLSHRRVNNLTNIVGAQKKLFIDTSRGNEEDNESNDRYFVDFRADRFSYGGVLKFNKGTVVEDSLKKNIIKIEIKPKDIINELSKPPTKGSLEGIDDKIKILKEKESFIEQKHAKKEVNGLIKCLENRKKFDMTSKSEKTYREYFSQFDTTDEIKIEGVLKKYNLRMDSADIFVPEFPDDAIKIMKEYNEKIQELCGVKAHYFVIAQQEDFQKQLNKRDPILLVQSPFGFYYYILGVWDDEMLYLPEL